MGLIVGTDAASGFFDFGAFVFGFEDFLLEAFGSRAGLATLFFAFVLFFEVGSTAGGFELVAEFGAGPVAVGGLGAFALAADFGAGGFVAEDDGGGGFIDFLAAGSGAANEGLGEVFVADAEFFESLFECGVEFEGGHGGGASNVLRSRWGRGSCRGA